MRGAFRVLDTERHVVEPHDIWEKYLEPAFKAEAPAWISPDSQATRIGGVAMSSGGPELARWSDPSPDFKDAAGDGFSAAANLRDMDKEGIDAAILFPSAGLSVIWGDNVAGPLAAAICRAYNNWLAEYCSADVARLRGLAMIPLQDPEAAVRELRRAVKELGMAGAFVKTNPIGRRQLHDPAYWPIYQEAATLGVPICVHASAGSILPEIGINDVTGIEHPEGVQRFGEAFPRLAASYPLELQGALISLAGGQPMMQFPSLKVHLASGGAGWLFAWLERMDDEWLNMGTDAVTKYKPGKYFRGRGLVSAYAHEKMLPFVAGEFLDNLAFGSGYPHPWLTDFPDELDPLLANDRLSASAKGKILWENAAAIFNL